MLSYWLYVSEALSPARSVEDVLLYFQSCNRNPVRGITGYLHRSSTHYAEYVEGPVDMMGLLEERILADERHTAIRTLAAGPIGSRLFSGWDMGFGYREITAFEDFQHLRGRAESLSSVSAEELLEFMLAVAPTAAEAARVEPNVPADPYLGEGRAHVGLPARRDVGETAATVPAAEPAGEG